MSSGFVSETELKAQREKRQKEWEKVRTEDQPLEAPEPEPHDGRTLYEKLQEQKDRKQEEFEESRKFKNQIKNLDEDECQFLDLVDKTKTEVLRKIEKEDDRELAEFRRAQASLEESAETERVRAEVQRPPTATTSQRPGGASAASGGAQRKSQSQLMSGVVKRRSRDASGGEPAQKAARTDGEDKNDGEKTGKTPAGAEGTDTSVTTTIVTGYPSAMHCVGVLPGVGAYTDSSDSDSDASSELAYPTKKKVAVSTAGASADAHKKQAHSSCGTNCKG